MYKRLHFIALIPKETSRYTVYLFEQEEKIVLPVEIASESASKLLKPHTKASQPSIYNTMRRVIVGLKATLSSATIYQHNAGTFYTYLNLAQGKRNLELNCRFSDALNLVKRFEVPLYIDQEVLFSQGIRVSKKILRDALRDDHDGQGTQASLI